tara:strand:+ start:13188 stop:14114 length:927 start_codon:yes stop_codon:yes gene_type:complete
MQADCSENIPHIDSFHLAGIISLLGKESDFNFPWADCLMPIAPNFLAIERSILECATVGCESIWIVCLPETQPLLKHRLGESVQDPVWFARNQDKFPSQTRKEIPIYYVDCNPKDEGKRDSQVWGVLYGARLAKRVTRSLSHWIEPDKYYVSFPMSIYPSQHLRKYRNLISKEGNFFVLTDKGESILNGKKIGFAFDKKYLGELIAFFWRKATGKFDSLQPSSERRKQKFITKVLPLEERYSGRFFAFDYIFKQIEKEPSTSVEMSWYYEVDSWEKWKTFLASKESTILKYPKLKLLNAGKWNKIGFE